MVERQDIDALLIGALYGELTPAEETRLAAHLESHPTDRTALEDLTRTRAALHASRILAFQVEPPQAVSALLLQEASRRAPKHAPARDENEGWFARFVRSFVQHPAMAAAAMLVIVVGAASIVSRNSSTEFADTAPVETVSRVPAASMESENAVATGTAAATKGAPAAPSSYGGLAAGSASTDNFTVQLAEPGAQNQRFDDGNAMAKNKGGKTDEGSLAFDGDGKVADSRWRAGAAPKRETAAKPSKPADSGLELRRREAAPKDLDERGEELETAAPAADDASRDQTGYRGQAGAGGGLSTTAPAAAPRPAPATTSPPPPPPPEATKSVRVADPKPDVAQRKDEKKAEDKAPNDPNLAWAKDQHASLIASVRANNCGRAANIALAIANRAPAYYAQNVETDRSVKECIAYINRERERDAEVRAAERAKKTRNEPAAPKRAVDQPSKATTSDSVK